MRLIVIYSWYKECLNNEQGGDAMRNHRLKLINARKNLGMTQDDLAKKAKISRAYLANLEVGKYTPSLNVARKLATQLNMSVDELFL